MRYSLIIIMCSMFIGISCDSEDISGTRKAVEDSVDGHVDTSRNDAPHSEQKDKVEVPVLKTEKKTHSRDSIDVVLSLLLASYKSENGEWPRDGHSIVKYGTVTMGGTFPDFKQLDILQYTEETLVVRYSLHGSDEVGEVRISNKRETIRRKLRKAHSPTLDLRPYSN